MATLHLTDEEGMQRLLRQAASSGALLLLKQVAEILDKGEGMAETIKRAKSSEGLCALHLAAGRGHTDICQYLVQELGIPVDFRSDSGATPLHCAAYKGQFGTVSYLIDQGADLTATDEECCTPFFCAANSGHAEVVDLFLSKGVPVDIAIYYGSGTALHLAATKGDEVLMKILLQHSADINNLMGGMMTPLHCCILSGSLKCVKLLIEAKADLNLGNPLEVAVYNNKMDMMKCLLNAGADPNIPSQDGNIPIEVAAVCDRKEMVEILFPLTRPIPQVKCWSIEGLYVHVNTEAFLHKLEMRSDNIVDNFKMKGADAFKRKEFLNAAYFYDAAIRVDSTDATLFANLSLCWLKAGFGKKALKNACKAQSLRPNWSKAYYRVGAAFMLLKEYEKAYRAFADGQKFNPTNEEINQALQNALEWMRKSEQ